VNHTETYAGGLEDLIRHLALVYDGREPVFAGADGIYTSDGSVSPSAARLRDLYREVVGPLTEPMPGAWRKCEACGHWGVDSTAR
jgi:hypothetical protein